MKRVLREPLVQFLIVGAALFAASTPMSGRRTLRSDEIVISAGQVEHLVARFTRTWRRAPTVEELQGLVDDYVREEVAYREGIAIGLDTDDAIIRRRIRQKLDFIASDVAVLVEPTEQDLQNYLDAHAEEFLIPSRYSFLQVYFDPGRRGVSIESDAQELLEMLRREPAMDVRELGDPTLVGYALEALSGQEAASLFGEDFAEALESLPWPSKGREGSADGQWYGPIASGYGLHLIRTDARVPGSIPELAEIADAVRREWENARRNALKEQYYTDLLQRYEVTIEWPELNVLEDGR